MFWEKTADLHLAYWLMDQILRKSNTENKTIVLYILITHFQTVDRPYSARNALMNIILIFTIIFKYMDLATFVLQSSDKA